MEFSLMDNEEYSEHNRNQFEVMAMSRIFAITYHYICIWIDMIWLGVVPVQHRLNLTIWLRGYLLLQTFLNLIDLFLVEITFEARSCCVHTSLNISTTIGDRAILYIAEAYQFRCIIKIWLQLRFICTFLLNKVARSNLNLNQLYLSKSVKQEWYHFIQLSYSDSTWTQ